ncbi:hypothetical protein ABZS94_28920 [Streptomyces sp. NPDC005500]
MSVILPQGASETGTQVISTQALTLPADPKAIRAIPMPRVYATP